MLNVIANPNAGKNQKETLLQALKGHHHRVHWTERPRHAEELARQIGEAHPEDTLVAAGGDGTVNEVISGLAQLDVVPRLAILPLGTGNDLCRSLDIPAELEAAMQIVTSGRATPVDLGVLRSGSKEVYFVNISAVGFSSAVDQALDSCDKQSWGALSYIKAGLEAMRDFEPLTAEVTLDGNTHRFCALNFIIANGRYAAAGIPVAPQAMANDGMFDFVAFLGAATIEQLGNVASLLRGTHLQADNIFYGRAKRITFKFSESSMVNIDGELCELPEQTLTYQVRPSALTILTGFTPEAITMSSGSRRRAARPTGSPNMP